MSDFQGNRVLRAGVIGAGRIVERAHLPVLTGMPDVALVGLFDPDLARAQRVGEGFGDIRAFPNVHALLDQPLDFVLIASPNCTHAEMSIIALESGAHVLCEKPMALCADEARTMADAARHADRELMVGFPNRFRPEVQYLRRVIRQGTLGRILSVRASWLRRQGVPGTGTWFTNEAKSGGGVLIDLGSHLLDLAFWLSGESELRSAHCVTHRATTSKTEANWYAAPSTNGNGRPSATLDVETSAEAFLVGASSLSISLEVSWARAIPEDKTSLVIQGEHGVAMIDTLFGFSTDGQRPEYPLRLWVDGAWSTPGVRTADDLLQPYRSQMEHFTRTIRETAQRNDHLAESVQGVATLDQLYASSRHGTSCNGPLATPTGIIAAELV